VAIGAKSHMSTQKSLIKSSLRLAAKALYQDLAPA